MCVSIQQYGSPGLTATAVFELFFWRLEITSTLTNHYLLNYM